MDVNIQMMRYFFAAATILCMLWLGLSGRFAPRLPRIVVVPVQLFVLVVGVAAAFLAIIPSATLRALRPW